MVGGRERRERVVRALGRLQMLTPGRVWGVDIRELPSLLFYFHPLAQSSPAVNHPLSTFHLTPFLRLTSAEPAALCSCPIPPRNSLLSPPPLPPRLTPPPILPLSSYLASSLDTSTYRSVLSSSHLRLSHAARSLHYLEVRASLSLASPCSSTLLPLATRPQLPSCSLALFSPPLSSPLPTPSSRSPPSLLLLPAPSPHLTSTSPLDRLVGWTQPFMVNRFGSSTPTA